MALWKETAQNEQRTMQSESSEKVERVEAAPTPAPAPVNPIPPRKESLPMDHQESVLGSGVTIEGELEGTVVASGQVTLAESGQVIGDLKAKTLTVAAGSRMRGNVEFGWNDSEAGKFANGRAHETGKTVSAAREQAGVSREL